MKRRIIEKHELCGTKRRTTYFPQWKGRIFWHYYIRTKYTQGDIGSPGGSPAVDPGYFCQRVECQTFDKAEEYAMNNPTYVSTAPSIPKNKTRMLEV